MADTVNDDLRNLAVDIAEHSKDKAVAVNFVKELREKTKIFAFFPEIGSIPDDKVICKTGNGEYSLFVSFRMGLYTGDENIFEIIMCFDSSEYHLTYNSDNPKPYPQVVS